MKRRSGFRAAALAALLAVSCSGCLSAPSVVPAPDAATPPPSATQSPAETAAPPDTVEQLLQSMTLREKVGQLFIIRPDALDTSLTQTVIDDAYAQGVTQLSKEMQTLLAEYPCGGVAMFSKNLTDPAQITAFNQALQESSTIPLFLCIDEEGGAVARLANHPAFDLPRYKSAAAVGEKGMEAVNAMGDTIGSYLHEYGFNVDFAPVADVFTNPENTVIGTRAFSSYSCDVADLADSMAAGLRHHNIMPVFKHFPGHGDTEEDSHYTLAVTYEDALSMSWCEWVPFEKAKSTDAVMVGHIAAPTITGDWTPASLSPAMVSGILKGQLGFTGLVMTDSLSMRAITDSWTPGDAAVLALQAGCDVLLMPADYRQAFDGVVTAVENGTLSMEQLDATVSKILNCKSAHGIL